MKTTYAPFDVAEYLDNDAEYLTATLEDANPQEGTEDDSPAMSPCIQGCHHPAMNYEAAPDFFQKVRLNPAPAAQALTLLILCASRLSEILGMRWDEIDIAAATWTLPPERQKKTGVAHIIPLSREALKILEEITKFRTQSEYVFPGRSWRKPISGQPLRDLMPPGATLHGWRSTFRDWAGDEAGVPREIAEGALAHLIGNPVERSYRRRTALERRRVVMEEWSAFLLTKQDIGIV